MLPLLKFCCPGLGPMWPFPLSALRKCTSYFENGVILVLLRMVTFFIILLSAFELLGFRLNVVDCQAVGVSSDVITDWWVGPERELCWSLSCGVGLTVVEWVGIVELTVVIPDCGIFLTWEEESCWTLSWGVGLAVVDWVGLLVLTVVITDWRLPSTGAGDALSFILSFCDTCSNFQRFCYLRLFYLPYFPSFLSKKDCIEYEV